MTQTDTKRISAPKTQLLLPYFMQWYFSERPHEIVHSYIQYAKAFGESFSLMFILKTLFSPWKSITDEYPDKGFNIELILQAFFLNLTSRLIGFVIRIASIIAGVAIQAALAGGFLAYLFLWIAFPVLLIAAIPVLFAFRI